MMMTLQQVIDERISFLKEQINPNFLSNGNSHTIRDVYSDKILISGYHRLYRL
jgi:hypothetical protein